MTFLLTRIRQRVFFANDEMRAAPEVFFHVVRRRRATGRMGEITSQSV